MASAIRDFSDIGTVTLENQQSTDYCWQLFYLIGLVLLFIVHIALDRCRRRSEHRRADGRGQRTTRVQYLHSD